MIISQKKRILKHFDNFPSLWDQCVLSDWFAIDDEINLHLT